MTLLRRNTSSVDGCASRRGSADVCHQLADRRSVRLGGVLLGACWLLGMKSATRPTSAHGAARIMVRPAPRSGVQRWRGEGLAVLRWGCGLGPGAQHGMDLGNTSGISQEEFAMFGEI